MTRTGCLLILLLLSGCTLYQPEIKQGNDIEESQLSQLEIGMSKEAVVFLLGSPAMIDPFITDTWIYYFRHVNYVDDIDNQRLVTIKFKNEMVTEIIKSNNDENVNREY